MEVVILPDGDAVAEHAAQLVGELVRSAPAAVLGVATGSSPIGIYRRLAAAADAGELSFERASAFALDEYAGLAAEDPHSYAAFIAENVTGPLGLDPDRVHVPDGNAADLAAAGHAYEAAIADAGGVDLQILGIGTNGHIGFNEPSSSFTSRTRVKALSRQTREDNARFFGGLDEVPTHCLTQGLGTIMDARKIVLVAQGSHKAPAVAGAVEGPVTAMCPASVLQFHPDAVLVVDEDAAAQLTLTDYYRTAYEADHAKRGTHGFPPQ